MSDEDDIGGPIGDGDRVALQQRIVALKLEHRDLDTAIAHLELDATHDELQLRRMKRRKLLLKDQIARLERQMDPDVPA
ncbi:MAG: YdcH family protein [Burkholderiales bacterium]